MIWRQNLFHRSYALRVALLGLEEWTSKWWFVLSRNSLGGKVVGRVLVGMGKVRLVLVRWLKELAGYPGRNIWQVFGNMELVLESDMSVAMILMWESIAKVIAEALWRREFQVSSEPPCSSTLTPGNALLILFLELCFRANHSHQLH